MTDADGERQSGIDFGALEARLDADYPVAVETLVEDHGGVELGLPGDATTVEAVLDGVDLEFESQQALREAVLLRVDDDAIEREGYTDRGGRAGNDETASF